MSYQVRRIDPFWFRHPALPAAVLSGTLLSLGAGFAHKPVFAAAGALIAGAAVLLATRPAITGTMFSLGFIGGLVTFVIAPSNQNALLTPGQRAMSVAFYTVFYAVLTEGAVLLFAVVYNFFSAVSSRAGISLELEEAGTGQD